MFLNIGIFKNFAMFKRKHLCWSLFLTKLYAWMSETSLKRYSITGVLLWILRHHRWLHLYLRWHLLVMLFNGISITNTWHGLDYASGHSQSWKSKITVRFIFYELNNYETRNTSFQFNKKLRINSILLVWRQTKYYLHNL